MRNWTRIGMYISAGLLILLDLFTLFNLQTTSGGAVFNQVMNAMAPCGLLLGVTVLLWLSDKGPKNALRLFTAIFFGLTALLRLFAFGFQMVLISRGGQATDKAEILNIIAFLAYAVLAVAVVFLMVYLKDNKCRKTTLVLFGCAVVILVAVWGMTFVDAISELVFLDTPILTLLLTICSADYLQPLVVIGVYSVIFFGTTKK